MYIVAKTIKDKEFIRSTKKSILCKNKKQANELSFYMNNSQFLSDLWKPDKSNNEYYKVYEIDKYDTQPNYEVKKFDNNILSINRIN